MNASEPLVTALDYGAMITGLGGGLALFLYGMRKMTDALKTVSGNRMKGILARLTVNRFSGALAGAAVTSVVQSSSVTTVMVVGFVSAGLITFSQSIGVILGANIGTTVTAQIIAFKVTDYALALIASGFALEQLGKSQHARYYGVALMGLGLIFFGMDLMSGATNALRTYPPFIELMQDLRNPLLGILGGLLFTALVQSSSATTGIVIVLASQGFITLEAGIALVLGANVGTCVTASLSAIGKPRDAVKAAVVHVLFNLGGVLLFVAFIPPFAELVRAISPVADGVAGVELLAAEVPRQIANAHTLFNVGTALAFLAFTGPLAALVDRIVPMRTVAVPERGGAVYLQDLYLEQPALALDRVQREIGRMGDLVLAILREALPISTAGHDAELRRLQGYDEDVDALHGAIATYLGKLSLRDMVEPQPRNIQACLTVANYLENIGDVVESGFVPCGYKRLQQGATLDPDVLAALTHLHGQTCDALRDALAAFADGDATLARAVRDTKDDFNRESDQTRLQLARHLGEGTPQRLADYRIGVDHLENLKRVHTLARRIARVAIAQGPDTEANVAET